MRKYILLLIVALFVLPVMSHADDYDVQGHLLKIYSDFITIDYVADTAKSNDTDSIPNGELSINIDSQTHYGNFNRLSDLKEGDYLGIELRVGANKKIAASITKLEAPPTTVVITPTDVQSTTTTTSTTVTTTNSAISPTP